MIEILSEIFGKLKNVNIEMEKADINVNPKGFSVNIKPQATEELPSGEIKLIEEVDNIKRAKDVVVVAEDYKEEKKK